MLSFECDYNKGAHKKILERLLETNEEPAKGYGFDPYCASAAEKILKACELAGWAGTVPDRRHTDQSDCN